MRVIEARWYATGQAWRLTFDADRLVGREEVPAGGQPWLAPSFCDVQINGALGRGFNSPNLKPDDVRGIAETCRQHGIGRLFPTVITDSYEAILSAFRTLNTALQQDRELARWIPGFHLEGPYLSGDDGPRGAHPKAHARDPDWEEFLRWSEAAGGHIAMITIAPERPGALPFIERCCQHGLVVAIGHTSASREQIQAAVEAGARTCTHLGNGSHAVLPRHDNYIWEQLADDRLWASLITDGHHLPPAVVKCFVRGKGLTRLLLTCDASSLAGLPPGRYSDWGAELEVQPGGRVVVPGTPFLAGSGCFTDHCVQEVRRMAGLTAAEAIELATVQPRRLMGLPIPKLELGQTADFLLYDWDEAGGLHLLELLGQ